MYFRCYIISILQKPYHYIFLNCFFFLQKPDFQPQNFPSCRCFFDFQFFLFFIDFWSNWNVTIVDIFDTKKDCSYNFKWKKIAFIYSEPFLRNNGIKINKWKIGPCKMLFETAWKFTNVKIMNNYQNQKWL